MGGENPWATKQAANPVDRRLPVIVVWLDYPWSPKDDPAFSCLKSPLWTPNWAVLLKRIHKVKPVSVSNHQSSNHSKAALTKRWKASETKTKESKVSFSYLNRFEYSTRRSAISPPQSQALTACVTHGCVKLDGSSRRWIPSCGANHPASQQAPPAAFACVLSEAVWHAGWSAAARPVPSPPHPVTRVKWQQDFWILLTA